MDRNVANAVGGLGDLGSDDSSNFPANVLGKGRGAGDSDGNSGFVIFVRVSRGGLRASSVATRNVNLDAVVGSFPEFGESSALMYNLADEYVETRYSIYLWVQ